MTNPHVAPDPFDAIADSVDLDDPAQNEDAQRFMLNALGRVMTTLPASAQSAVSIAGQHFDGRATAAEVLAARVTLWTEIRGRDQSDEPNVLRIRTTICALYGMEIKEPYQSIEHFLWFWERSGLSMVELAAAMFDVYGISYMAG